MLNQKKSYFFANLCINFITKTALGSSITIPQEHFKLDTNYVGTLALIFLYLSSLIMANAQARMLTKNMMIKQFLVERIVIIKQVCLKQKEDIRLNPLSM